MREQIALIVSAYVKRNTVSSADLPALISQVGEALFVLNKSSPLEAPTPAVPIRRSVLPDAVVCLDCGWRGKMLRQHLHAAHRMTPEAYRSRWGLKGDHPLVSPSYSNRRSAMAVSSGFGRRSANQNIRDPAA
jgi:predicted transcriptional regulator